MQLFLEFQSVEALKLQVEDNLAKGRAFVPGEVQLKEREACELVLIHPLTGEWMPLAAEAVFVGEGEHAGVGIELLDKGSAVRDALRAFAAQLPSEAPPSEAPPSEAPPSEAPPSEAPPSEAPESFRLTNPPPAPESLLPASAPATPPASSSRPPPPIQLRVREMNAIQRDKLARTGNLSERTALERAFGSVLWESLLSNAQLTPPEVARIAKNGTVSQPILNQIVGNAAWASKPEVRRALLSNPRLTVPHIERVLRSLPRTELKLIPKQTAYPPKVRAAAAKLIG